MKNIISWFKKKKANDYDKDYPEIDDLYIDPEEDPDDIIPYGETKADNISPNVTSSHVSLKIVKPKSYADGPAIANQLASGNTVLLNIESLDRASVIRLVDFLMGTIHVLGGDMKSVTKTTFVFTPRNVGVSGVENIKSDEELDD